MYAIRSYYGKAGYDADPRQSGALDRYQVVEIDLSQLTLDAVSEFGLSKSDAIV